MHSVSVSELKARTGQVVRRVYENGDTLQVTIRGKVVALLIPVRDSAPANQEDTGAIWSDLDRLAAEISAQSQTGVDAAEEVSAERR